MTLVTLVLTLSSANAMGQWGAHQEWMGLIDQSCATTLKGKAKRFAGEKEFWVEVNVSMSMWIRDMTNMDYAGFCRASYPNPEQTERLMRCLNSVKRDIDWFKRCKSAVELFCHQAGGYCR